MGLRVFLSIVASCELRETTVPLVRYRYSTVADLVEVGQKPQPAAAATKNEVGQKPQPAAAATKKRRERQNYTFASSLFFLFVFCSGFVTLKVIFPLAQPSNTFDPSGIFPRKISSDIGSSMFCSIARRIGLAP